MQNNLSCCNSRNDRGNGLSSPPAIPTTTAISKLHPVQPRTANGLTPTWDTSSPRTATTREASPLCESPRVISASDAAPWLRHQCGIWATDPCVPKPVTVRTVAAFDMPGPDHLAGADLTGDFTTYSFFRGISLNMCNISDATVTPQQLLLATFDTLFVSPAQYTLYTSAGIDPNRLSILREVAL